MNFDLKIKEVALETFLLTGKIFDQEIILNLKKFIKENIDNVLSHNTHVKGKFTGFRGLINNKDFINFLKTIEPYIKIVYNKNFEILDAWGNICKQGEEVIEHDHRAVNAFCGILYLTEGGPGTHFKEYDLTIEEEIGKFILFHPYLLHKVKKIEKDIERITVAFNINFVNKWNEVKYIG
jgi:hypothetical protein